MKKLYISCPIVGRDWKDVVNSFEKMHKIAEVMFDEKLEIINPPMVVELEGIGLKDLSRHMTLMSESDYFIGVIGCDNTPWNTCHVESVLARESTIPVHHINYEYIAPDCEDIMNAKCPISC